MIHIIFTDPLHGAFGIRIIYFKLVPPIPLKGAAHGDKSGLTVKSCLILKAFIESRGAEIFAYPVRAL